MATSSKKNNDNEHFFLNLAKWVDALDKSLENAYRTRPTNDPSIEQALLEARDKSQMLKKKLLDLYLNHKN